MKKILSVWLCVFTVLQLFVLTGCNVKKEKFNDYSFDYFDTVTTITGFEKNEEVFKENCEKIKKQLYEYHRLYTIYNRYDDINNLCTLNSVSNGTHKEQTVDKKIIDLLKMCKEIYTLTNGKVNVAMGSVLSIWHDFRESGINNPSKAELPDIKDLKKASVHTDINDIEINEEKSTVFLSDPEMTLDVGAIAKGYAVEETAKWMKEQGIDGYILNVGGNVRIIGSRPDEKKWTVGIEKPDTDSENGYIAYVSFNDMSLVTSGSYQRFYVVDGKNYHHIIDPETLYPAENFLSVSVLCESSAMADALSTALFSMTLDDGKNLIEKMENTEVLWVLPDGKQEMTKGFKNYIVD